MFTRTDPEWNELDSWSKGLAEVAAVSNEIPNDASWHCVAHFDTEFEARLLMESPAWTAPVTRCLHYNGLSEKPYWVMASKHAPTKAILNPTEQFGENAVALCEMMGPIIEENGYKIANKYPRLWYQNAKLVFDRAAELGKTPESVFALAKWALKDEFWSQNIRSTDKFYKHYDRLREQANQAHAKNPSMQTNWERTRAKSESIWDALEAAEANKEQK